MESRIISEDGSLDASSRLKAPSELLPGFYIMFINRCMHMQVLQCVVFCMCVASLYILLLV